MTLQSPIADDLITGPEVLLAAVAAILLLTWPLTALWVRRQTGRKLIRILLVPVVAAFSTAVLLLLVLRPDRHPGEIALALEILAFSSGSAAVGSCLMLMGAATQSLPRVAKFAAGSIVAAAFYFGVQALALIPFGQASSGWSDDPDPIVAWVPFVVAFVVPAALTRQTDRRES